MNSFGTLFRVQVFGESHGPAVGVIIDGVPPGIPVADNDFEKDLERRKGGMQKGTTPRREEDKPVIESGIFQGHTTGSPVCIRFENNNTRSSDYDKLRSIPRPGHADFAAHIKYRGFEDYRGGGHFSARVTVGIVAAGVIARKILQQHYPGFTINAQITAVAGYPDIEVGLQKAIEAKDSVGAILQTTVEGIPVGLGAPFWDSVESVLAHAMFAIPAVKGIEFGAGFAVAKMFGSEHNDSIINAAGTTKTNHAGGITGGISNGNPIVFRLAFKPTASTPKEQESWNRDSGQVETFSVKGRHDLCVALRAPVIAEAMTAIALCDLCLSNK